MEFDASGMAGIGLWVMDIANHRCQFDITQCDLTGVGTPNVWMDAETFLGGVHPEDRPGVDAGLTRSRENGCPYDAEFRFQHGDGHELWLAGRGQMADDGLHLAGANWDVTDRKKHEHHIENVSNEMSHRVKNLISVVSGISTMTVRSSHDLDDYNRKFSQRLNAIGTMSDAILQTSTSAVALKDVIANVLQSVGAEAHVTYNFQDFALNRKAAQTLILVLNELATNAIKYGALHGRDGSVEVTIKESAADDTFDLVWEETVSREIKPPGTSSGFGMTVLNSMTQQTFNGNPRFEWRPEGLRYSCRWLRSQMAASNPDVGEETA